MESAHAERRRPEAPPSPNTKTATKAIHPDPTSRRIDRLETRVTKLEQKSRPRQPKGCIVDDERGTFLPGRGWIKPWVAT